MFQDYNSSVGIGKKYSVKKKTKITPTNKNIYFFEYWYLKSVCYFIDELMLIFELLLYEMPSSKFQIRLLSTSKL